MTAGSRWRCELLLSSSSNQGQADWPRLMGRCGARRGGGQAPRGGLHLVSKLSLFTTRAHFTTSPSTNRINLGCYCGGLRSLGGVFPIAWQIVFVLFQGFLLRLMKVSEDYVNLHYIVYLCWFFKLF